MRQQQTVKHNVLHCDKIKLVDPTLLWDECSPRPLRSQCRPIIRKSLNATGKSRPTSEVEVEDIHTNQMIVSCNDTDTANPQGTSQEVSHDGTSGRNGMREAL